jgi:hypothetical protein
MTTGAPTLKPVETALAQRVDFPTWLPAMLVKELRQGLRARGFVGTMVGFQVIMTLILVFAIAGGNGSASFELLQGAYWVVLNVQLLVITPMRGIFGLQSELDSRAIDLLLLTRLTAWRVVVGKWISLLVQAGLLLVAMLPYGVARYFFGSIDLAGEVRLMALLLAIAAVLTAAALWSSAWPRVARIAVGLAVLGSLQFVPGSLVAILIGNASRGGRGGGPAASIGSGAELWLLLFDATLVLILCLVGAVRKIAPRAESQAPLVRVLPALAFLPIPFLKLSLALGQLSLAVILIAVVAAPELARAEEPMACHWRAWTRRGWAGRLAGRFFQPGWASAMEWVLLLAAAAALGGLATDDPRKVALLAMLGAEALVFPALLLTWMSQQFTQRAAGYALVLGGASVLSAAGNASSATFRLHELTDLTLVLLPISSFWSTLMSRVPMSPLLLTAQILIAGAVLGGAWRRARPYRMRRRDYDAAAPDSAP